MDEGPFFDAILENPDDAAVWRVYADFLEEQGDPYGEWLRLQFPIGEEGTEKKGARKAAEARQQELVAEFGDRWLRGLADRAIAINPWPDPPRRVTAFLSAEAFLEAGLDLLRALPLIGMVRLHNAAACLSKLVECRHLLLVRSLNLSGALIGDRGMKTLAASPYLRRLRGLYLGENYLGPTGASALASAALPELLTLDLTENFLSDDGARSLGAGGMPRLALLNLRENQIGGYGATAIVCSPNRRLAKLDLRNNPISEETCYTLQRRKPSTLTMLWLDYGPVR